MNGDAVSTLALSALCLYGLVTLVGKTLLQRHRDRDSGWRGIHGAPGNATWWAGMSLIVGIAGLPIALLLVPTEANVPTLRLALGALGYVVGFAFTLHAQAAMGRAWRIGVRPGEQTALKTDGPFRWCRNPVFAGMLATTGALVVWSPALAMPWALLWLGLELQVRVVEEPHLQAVHGDAYRAYARATGRFVPKLGRLRPQGPQDPQHG